MWAVFVGIIYAAIGLEGEGYYYLIGNCKTLENSNFLKKGKIVISVKIHNFSRYWMMKRTSPLESSRD